MGHTSITEAEADNLYKAARSAIIQKVDYWTEHSHPSMLSLLKTCQQLADVGYGKAYYLLHLLYDCKQDSAEAPNLSKLYEKMAYDWSMANSKREDVELWNDLGDLNLNWSGEESRAIEAMFWYRKAAKKGYDVAQYSLAECYRFGIGVPENLFEAIQWCSKSAEQGNPLALANKKHMLGELATQSEGIVAITPGNIKL